MLGHVIYDVPGKLGSLYRTWRQHVARMGKLEDSAVCMLLLVIWIW